MINKKTFLFRVTFRDGGLLDVMTHGISNATREDYLTTNPTFFDCDTCDKQDTLHYEVESLKTSTSFWCCSEGCANMLILREI